MAQETATPKWAVQAPDGKIIQFPDEFTDADVNREMGKLYPQAPQPNAAQRYSEITLGTQHPLDELKAEGKNVIAHPKEAAIGAAQSLGETLGIPKDFWAHPGDQFQNIGGTGIPGMIFGENGLIKSPLKFGENFTGATQAAEDVRNKNYKAIPGDIAGGLTNLALAKKPAESAGAALADTAQNAKAGIADAVRTPENKLTPTTKAVARGSAALLGHATGIPGGEIAGVFSGPSLADSFLPKRAETPNFFGGAYQPPEVYPGASLPSANDFYQNRGTDIMKRGAQEDALAKKAGTGSPSSPTIIRPSSTGEPLFSGSEGRAATWTNQDVQRLAAQGNREAIQQAVRRGMQLPANSRYVMGDPDFSRAIYNPKEVTRFTPEGTPIRNRESMDVSSKKLIEPAGSPYAPPVEAPDIASPYGPPKVGVSGNGYSRSNGNGNGAYAPVEPSAPLNPQEVADMSAQLQRSISASDVPDIRRRLDAERNINAGLSGNRTDVAGEIRETHRAKLEKKGRI